jgi:photoactive yellow protein
MSLRFDEPDLLEKLEALDPRTLDELMFGVIGFGGDTDACVLRYGAFEATQSGLSPASVIGLPFFSVVAQCMNNYLVAQRFEDAKTNRTRLDVSLDYVLTLRMRPTHSSSYRRSMRQTWPSMMWNSCSKRCSAEFTRSCVMRLRPKG